MKNGNNRIEVKFAGLRNYVDGENAVAGECERMVNLRERRDAVAAVGRCMEVGELATSERLVAMHYVAGGRHLISAAGNTLYWHGTVADDGTESPRGTVIAVATAEIGAVAAVGDFVVAATASGNVVVQYDASAGAYSQVDTSGMVPRLLLSPSGRHTFSDVVAASEFDNPVTHWQRPLPTADVERISANAADAYERLRRCAAVEGYLLQPVLARYAVRLWDDSYLWVSAPLLIGNGIQSMATVATAATDGSAFTGVNTATAQVQGYRVSVVVEEGTAAACDRLVKSVDILVCDEIDPVDYSSLVDYTCVRSTTGGTVAYSMGYEFPAADGTALLSRLPGCIARRPGECCQLPAVGQCHRLACRGASLRDCRRRNRYRRCRRCRALRCLVGAALLPHGVLLPQSSVVCRLRADGSRQPMAAVAVLARAVDRGCLPHSGRGEHKDWGCRDGSDCVAGRFVVYSRRA